MIPAELAALMQNAGDIKMPDWKYRMNRVDSCSSDSEAEQPVEKTLEDGGLVGGGGGGSADGPVWEGREGPMPVKFGLPTQTLLHEMIGINRVDKATKHLDKGTGVNTPDCMGETPLFWAGSAEAIDYLVGEGADIEWRNSVCNTSAFYKFACQGKHKPLKALARHLKRAGFLHQYVNDPATYTLRTPLHAAACNGFTDTVRELLSMGADKTAKDSHGKTALDLARARDFDDIITLLQ